MSDAASWNEEELLAVLLSREVRDGEICGCGAHSMLPAAGLLLAQALHAPNITPIILGAKAYMPFNTSRQFHYLAQRGDLGLFFVSGVQIDKHGNYNLHQIGAAGAPPKRRFPGGYGGGMIYYAARRTVVFRTEHTRRTFVSKVDYISAAGSTEPDVMRHGNPTKVVTPLANLNFDAEADRLRLESLHPGHTLEDVQAQTGFSLGKRTKAPTTPSPSEEELYTLRSIVRSTMIHTDTYPDWARQAFAEADAWD